MIKLYTHYSDSVEPFTKMENCTMGKYDQVRKKKTAADRLATISDNNLNTLANEHARVAELYENAPEILRAIDRQFEQETGLTGLDVAFLFFAVALQCARQYLLTPFEERQDDQSAANSTKGHDEEHSNRKHKYYNPSFEEIHSNPVPFDANLQADGVKGALKGAGKLGHRLTLGHDPILGWIFGTANIATSTLTTWDFRSYHIKTGEVKRRGGKMAAADFLTNHADTKKVLHYTKEKLLHQGIDGKLIILESLRKEWVHLQSDVKTKHSLPFPIISTISTDLANTLADYGIDTYNIGKVADQAAMAEAINVIIAMLHGMVLHFRQPQPSPEELQNMSFAEYEDYHKSIRQQLNFNKVRTRKIILYSNIIASASNIIKVGVSVYLGNADAVRELDVGGIMVTIEKLISEPNFIHKIKLEFIQNKWAELVLRDGLHFEGVD